MDYIQVLSQTPLFQGFQRQELVAFVRWLDAEEIEAGQVLIAEGEPQDSFYVLCSGRVVISKQIRGEVETVLVHLDAPAHFGELSLVDERGSTASVTVEQRGMVLRFPRKRLKDLLAADSQLSARFAWALNRDLATKLRKTNQKLQEAVIWGLDATGAET